MPGQQVTLPGVGPVSRKALLAGGAAAALVMGLLWWRKRNTPTTPAVDPNALDPNAFDAGGGSGIAGGGGSLTGPTDLATGAAPTTNSAWTALAMTQLAFEDPSILARALGLYLTGGAVTPDQERLVDEAIAAAGYPPVHGPGGYPPAIRTQPSTGQGTPTTTNEQWRSAALAWIARQPGNAGTTVLNAQIAVNDYLAGKPIPGWEGWTIQTIITGTNQLGQHFEAGIGYPPNPPKTPF